MYQALVSLLMLPLCHGFTWEIVIYCCVVITMHSRLKLQTSWPTSFMGQESRTASLSSSGSASPSPYVLDLTGLQSAESIWD